MLDEANTKSDGKPASLLDKLPQVINVGLERFAKDLEAQQIAVQHLEWGKRRQGDRWEESNRWHASRLSAFREYE